MSSHGGKNKLVDKDRGFADLFKRVEALRGKSHVKVGVLADSDRGGLHVPGASLTVAEIAAVLEFGTQDGKIPARSFVRSTFDEMRGELTALAAELIAAVVLDGKMDAARALGLLGLKLATGIREKIVGGSGVPPPNAPSTLRAKQNKGKWNKGGKAQAAGWGVRTLVDSGRLLASISYAVVQGGAQQAAKYVKG